MSALDNHTLTRQFLELPYRRQLNILERLKLLSEDDPHQATDAYIASLAFRRAVERGQLQQLREAVFAETPASSAATPPVITHNTGATNITQPELPGLWPDDIITVPLDQQEEPEPGPWFMDRLPPTGDV